MPERILIEPSIQTLAISTLHARSSRTQLPEPPHRNMQEQWHLVSLLDLRKINAALPTMQRQRVQNTWNSFQGGFGSVTTHP